MCPTRTAPTKTLTLALFYPTFSVGHPEKNLQNNVGEFSDNHHANIGRGVGGSLARYYQMCAKSIMNTTSPQI